MKKPKLKPKKSKKLPKYQEGGIDQQTELQTNPLLGMGPQTSGIVGLGAGLAGTAVDQFVDVNQTTGQGAIGKGIASGALKGASAGAAFGPVGMGVGALVGGGIGALQGKQQKENIQATERDRLYQIEREKADKQAEIYQQQKDKYVFKKGGKMCYPQGGLMGMPNAELEKQENVLYPDGETEQFNGQPHSNGGIDVNLPPQTKIFSDKLKSQTGKTFAKEAKKFATDKFTKILEDQKADKLAKNSAQMMFNQNNMKLDKLFNEQESQKAEKLNKGIQRLQKKYGGMMPKYATGGYSAKDAAAGKDLGKPGKNFDKIAESAAKKYGSKEAGQRVAGAILAKLRHEEGGVQPYDPNKDYFGYSMYNNPPGFGEPFPTSLYFKENPNTQFSAPADAPRTIPNLRAFSPTAMENTVTQIDKSSVQSPIASSIPATTALGSNSNQPNYANLAFQGANFLGQNLSSLKYLRDEGKRYDKVDYGTVKPDEVKSELLNVNPALENARRQAANTRAALKRGAVGGASYLSNVGASQAGLIGSTGSIVDKYIEANTGIKNKDLATNVAARNQAKMFNQQNRILAMRDEAANKGQSLTNYYKALGATGQNVAGQSRDILAGQMDQKKLTLLKEMFPNAKMEDLVKIFGNG